MHQFTPFILFLAVLSAFFDRISVAVLFTDADFQNAIGTGFNPTLLGLLMTSFVFAYGCSGVLLSFAGDVFGPSRMLAIGTAGWGVFMALMAASGSFAAMLLCRILLGVAEGPQFSITNSLIKRWFPPQEQARANSIWTVGSPLGSAIGFPFKIYLESTWGWRSAFFFLAALNLAVILPLVLQFLRDQPPRRRCPGRPDAGWRRRIGSAHLRTCRRHRSHHRSWLWSPRPRPTRAVRNRMFESFCRLFRRMLLLHLPAISVHFIATAAGAQ